MPERSPTRDKTIAALVVGGALAVIGIGAALWRRMSRTPSTAESQPRHLIKPGVAIAVAGDSIGQGLAPRFDALAKASGAKLVYSGAEKNTLIPTWSRSPARIAKILASGPGVIFVSLGTNDAAAANPTSWSGEVEHLISQLSAGGAAIVWIESPSEGLQNLAAVHAMLASSPSIASGKVLLVDSRKAGVELGPDHVHPTGKGYETLAKAAWEAAS